MDFERRIYTANDSNIYYYPKSYSSGGTRLPYLGSYTSIIGSTTLNSISTTDMYRYMNTTGTDGLQEVYFRALGRERVQRYNVQNGVDEEDTHTTEDGTIISNWYYLQNYYVDTY